MTSGARDRGCLDGPGIGVFASVDPFASSVSSRRSATGGLSATALLAVHVTSQSSSESSQDSSSARSRKFGSDFLAHPGTPEPSSLCRGTRWEMDVGM